MAAATTSRENLSAALTIHLIIGLLIDGETDLLLVSPHAGTANAKSAQLDVNGCPPPGNGAHPGQP